MGYVWQKNQIYQLGQQIKKREIWLEKLENQNEKLKNQLGTIHTVQYLEKRIRELNLGLAAPQPSMVWRLPEPAREVVRPVAEHLFTAEERQLSMNE